jgi:DNA (cytosine-5)-methyltransferase 1
VTFGSLFAGIGGMDLGLERAGMECKWQVEINPFCQKVLAKHWPNVRRYGDITAVEQLEYVDVIAGGFPCQDISYAGAGAGIDGERSGLWSEMLRIIRIVRPRFVIVENVAALLTRGIERVLGQLAESGYDAEWQCLPAAAFGAPHIRGRLFIIATTRKIHYANCLDKGSFHRQAETYRRWAENPSVRPCLNRGAWARDPGVARVAYGIPDRMDRLKGLGNAVVPQVAEYIGQRINLIHHLEAKQ